MDLVGLAKNPVPSGASVGVFSGHDGAELRYARWTRSRGPKRGTVCLFGGRGEFIEKYFEVVADLRRRGFAVATMDWRGQGGSGPRLRNRRKGHVRRFSDYDRDLLRFMKDIVLPDCPPPYVALGHSMGAHILLRNAVMPGSWFERMILVAPMIRLARATMPAPAMLVRGLAGAACLLGAGGLYVPGGGDIPWEVTSFEGNPLTSDRERFMRNRAIVEAAPDLAIGAPTIGWLRAALASMRKLQAPGYPARVRMPLLLVAAAEDKIVSSRTIEDFSLKLKVGSCIVIPHARHEILQERDALRQQFWAVFDAYVGVD